MTKKWVLTKTVTDRKIAPEHFRFVEEALPALQPNEMLLQINVINVHSGTRERMGSGVIKPGETDYTNFACGTVLASRNTNFKEGDVIACQGGWMTHQIVNPTLGLAGTYLEPPELVYAQQGSRSPWIYPCRKALVDSHTTDVLMDVFGTSGTTAYFGCRECGPLTPRDTVAVAGTTGSVGAMVAQIAKAKGCRVVGFGGGPDRAQWVRDAFGIEAIDYRAKDLDAQLAKAFPNGVDFFSDGTQGDLSEAITKIMNQHGRYFSYGSAAARYTEGPQAPPRPKVNPEFSTTHPYYAQAAGMGMTDSIYRIILQRNIKLEAWQAQWHYTDREEAENYLDQLVFSKRLKPVNTVIEGIENVPKAIMAQYTTNPYGKLQVKFA